MSTLPSSIVQKRFLVVDDFESMRVMLSTQLKKLGVSHVATCKSGNEAFKFLNAKHGTPEQIDFVMTDMIMTDGTGVELVGMIRKVDKLKTLPVLMISSITEVDLMLDAVNAGVNDYIVKPWQEAELAKKIITLMTDK